MALQMGIPNPTAAERVLQRDKTSATSYANRTSSEGGLPPRRPSDNVHCDLFDAPVELSTSINEPVAGRTGSVTVYPGLARGAPRLRVGRAPCLPTARGAS